MNKVNGRILIRISFDKSNIDEVKKLILYLKYMKLKNELELYFAPIHQTSNQQNNLCSFCNVNAFMDTLVIENLYKELYLYAKENGFYVPEHYFNGPPLLNRR